MYELNFLFKLCEMKKFVVFWLKCLLSLVGKIIVIKFIILLKIIYLIIVFLNFLFCYMKELE